MSLNCTLNNKIKSSKNIKTQIKMDSHQSGNKEAKIVIILNSRLEIYKMNHKGDLNRISIIQ